MRGEVGEVWEPVAAAPWHRSWLRGRLNFKIAAAAGSWCLESGRRGLRCAGLRAVASSGAAARDLTLQPPDLRTTVTAPCLVIL